MTTTQISSNDLTIDDLEARIGQEYSLAKELAGEDIEEAVEHGRVLGQLLDRAKYKMASSEWNEWLRNTVGMSRKDAGKFMRLAVGEAPSIVTRQWDYRGEKSKRFHLETDKNGKDIWREESREIVALLLWLGLPEVQEAIGDDGLSEPRPQPWIMTDEMRAMIARQNEYPPRYYKPKRTHKVVCHCPDCEHVDLSAGGGHTDATEATRLEELLNFDRMSDEDTQFRRDLATLSPDLAIRTREPVIQSYGNNPTYQRHPYPGRRAEPSPPEDTSDPDNVFEAMAKGIAQWRLDQRLRAKHTTSRKRESMPVVLSEAYAKGIYHLSWQFATWLDGIYPDDDGPYDRYRDKMAILLGWLRIEDPNASACVESALGMLSHVTPASMAHAVGITGSDRADVVKDRIRRGVEKMKVLAEERGMVTGTPRQPAHKPYFDLKLPGRLPTENLPTDLDEQVNLMKRLNAQEMNGVLVVPPFSGSKRAKPLCVPMDQVTDDLYRIEVTRERDVEVFWDAIQDDDDAYDENDSGSERDRLQQEALLNPPERLNKPAKTRNLAMVIEAIRSQMPDFVSIPPKVDGRRERSKGGADHAYTTLCRMFQEQGSPVKLTDWQCMADLPARTMRRYVTALQDEGMVKRTQYGYYEPVLMEPQDDALVEALAPPEPKQADQAKPLGGDSVRSRPIVWKFLPVPLLLSRGVCCWGLLLLPMQPFPLLP